MLMIPKTVSTPIRSSSFSRSSATVIFWVIPTNSSAPTGLGLLSLFEPRACARGYTLSPLRGCVPSRGAAKECSPGRQPWVYRHKQIQPRRGERKSRTISLNRSAAAYLAAERRKSVAQGVSPGFAVTNEFSPVGAKENQYDLV